MGLRNLKLTDDGLKTNLVRRISGIVVCVIFIILILATALPQRQNTTYYQMITERDYMAFTWIRDNLGKEYDKAILDPWKATPFTAITMKKTYSREHTHPTPDCEEALAFLNEGSTDTAFLKENGISIIYTPKEVDNPDLVEVRENVYLLRGVELEQ